MKNKDYYKKIIVQKRLTKRVVKFLFTIFTIFEIIFLLLIFSIKSNYYTIIQFFTFTALVLLWISRLNKQSKSPFSYVSELLLTDKTLTIIYKNTNSKTQKKIDIFLDDIKHFFVQLSINTFVIGYSLEQNCVTEVEIQTKNDRIISFTETPSLLNFSLCNYSFMLRLLKIANRIPNFSYKIQGNDKAVKEDIEHFIKYGKRLNFLQSINNQSPNRKVIDYIFLLLILFGFIFILISMLFYILN